jgi:RNA polymerase sigma factor (sigma-70 family)
MPEEDDAELVQGFRAGDEAAFEQLMAAHKEALHRFIFRHVHDRAECEDILVRTFTKAWQNRSSYEPRALLTTWLHAIAINLCRDHARKRKRRPGDFVTGESRIDANSPESRLSSTGSPDPAAMAADHEEALLLRSAIDELPHDLKSALILCSLEGHSQESAAQILNCSAKAIETRIYRAKQHLRSRLKRFRLD